MSDLTHPIVETRHHPLDIFTIVVYGVGVVATVITFFAARNLWGSLALLVPFLIVGAPIPDKGHPHEWVLREWERRAQWRRDKGRLMVPALLGEPNRPPCDIERVEGVLARVKTTDQTDAFIPLMTDDTRNYATVALRLSGASPQWLGSDSDGKFDWDMAWFAGIAQALGITEEPELEVYFTHAHRPVDVEDMLRLGGVRYEEKVLAAAVTDPESVDGRLGQNIIDRIDMVYGVAGKPLEYVFVRTPWPRGWRGKIGVDNAEAFKRTPLFRTIQEIKLVYEQLGIQASLLLPREAQELWDELLNVTNLAVIRMYRRHDREHEQLLARLAEEDAAVSSDDETNADPDPEATKLELQMTQSLRSGDPKKPGFLCYGGTYHLAGYVKLVKQDRVRAAFRRGLVLDDDVYWTQTLVVMAKLRDREARKTREQERGLNMAEGINPLKRGVSDPEGDKHWYDVVTKRIRLRDASNRVPHAILLISVAGRSLEEAEARWADMVVKFAQVYRIERCHDPEDIEDILLAHQGLRIAGV